jgi:hypothetical protein
VKSKYVLTKTDKSYCSTCHKGLLTLLSCDTNRGPWFYICFACEKVTQVGKGPVLSEADVIRLRRHPHYEVRVKFPTGLETTVHEHGKSFTMAEADEIVRVASAMTAYKGCVFRIVRSNFT